MNDLLFQAVLAIFSLSFESFTIWSWIALGVITCFLFKIADTLSSSQWIWHDVFEFPKIKSHRIWSDEDLDVVDHLYVSINRMVTTPLYFYHTAMWYREYATNDLFDVNFGITHFFHPLTLVMMMVHFASMFMIYDAIYVPFHRTLHIPWIYPYIHKHHHRQVSPFRGTYDGINTHPFEYIFGLYLHLWSIMLVTYFTSMVGIPSGGVHVVAILGFYLVSALMASWNHTRYAIRIPYVYDVRDHDVHHRWPRSNYAQFIMVWDRLLGSFKSYEELERKGKGKGKRQ